MTPPVQSPLPAPELLALARRYLARGAAWLTWAYLGGLFLLILWLEHAAERFWFTGILIFAPPAILLLPLLVLSPFCLLVRPRLLLWHVLAVVMVLFGFMTFHWGSRPAAKPGEITVVTHNAGQNSRPQFDAFLKATDPDLIVLQDAGGRGADLSRKNPKRYVSGKGEFLLLSRFPVLNAEPVQAARWYGRPVAMRFELACQNRPLILYSVHLPTPRQQLNRYLSGRAIARMFLDDDTAAHPQTDYKSWTAAREKLAQDLADVLSKETLPFLVCGDFNTPDHGVIYRTVSRQLQDAHRAGGRGWGFTFPGATHNPLSLGGPWLRIDYAFAGRGWKPVYCQPEPGRRSQHCAVLARFAPVTE